MTDTRTLPAYDVMDFARYRTVEARNPETGRWVRVSGSGSTLRDDRTREIREVILAVRMPDERCRCDHGCDERVEVSSMLERDGAIRVEGNPEIEVREVRR